MVKTKQQPAKLHGATKRVATAQSAYVQRQETQPKVKERTSFDFWLDVTVLTSVAIALIVGAVALCVTFLI